MRLGVCILLIIVIWIVGISISLPLAIYMRFEGNKCEVSERECNEPVCRPRFLGILAAVHVATLLQLLVVDPAVSHTVLGHLVQLL